MRLVRLAGYLLINILISATVAVAVLLYWENNRQPVVSSVINQDIVVGGDGPSVLLNGLSGQSGTQPAMDSIIYRVRSGDTMGSIAMQYEIAIDELMRVNGLNDPNALSIDQLLIIPARQLELPTERPIATRAPISAVLTPQPPAAVATSNLPPVITIRAVNGAGDLDVEQVVLLNVGGAVNLVGWTLVQPDGDAYYFPDIRLYQTGQIIVHTRSGQDTVTDIFRGLDQAIWKSGQAAHLLDADGNIHATFQLP